MIWLLLSGCLDTEPPVTELQCTGVTDADLEGVVTVGPTERAVDGDLRVEGSITHLAGLAVHRVEVAGFVASNDGFNFDAWSVVLPFDGLLAMDPMTGGAREIEVTATDTCDNAVLIDRFDVFLAEDDADTGT